MRNIGNQTTLVYLQPFFDSNLRDSKVQVVGWLVQMSHCVLGSELTNGV